MLPRTELACISIVGRWQWSCGLRVPGRSLEAGSCDMRGRMTLYPALGFFSMPGFSWAKGGWHSALLWHVSPIVILCPVSQHPGLALEGNQCSLTAVPAPLPTLWPRMKHWWGGWSCWHFEHPTEHTIFPGFEALTLNVTLESWPGFRASVSSSADGCMCME